MKNRDLYLFLAILLGILVVTQILIYFFLQSGYIRGYEDGRNEVLKQLEKQNEK